MSTYLGAAGLDYALPDGTPLFSDLTFHLEPGRSGLVGRNGVGKSTLLELLAGVRRPSRGRVLRTGRSGYLAQTFAHETEATVLNVLGVAGRWAALDRIERGEAALEDFDLVAADWDLPARIETVMDRMGVGYIAPDRCLRTLSGGELVRIRLAALLFHDPQFLLLDEPTNHLDAEARRFVYDLVGGWSGGLLVVSHDRTLLGILDRIAELTPDGLRLYGGGLEFYLEQRRIEREAAEQSAAAASQRLRDAKSKAREAQERQARRTSAGRRQGRQSGMGKMAAGIAQRAAENTAGRLGDRHDRIVAQARAEQAATRARLPADRQIHVDLMPTHIHAGKRMAEAIGLRYRHPGTTTDAWPHPLSFRINGGERMAIAGPNGSGKTTLVDLIRGKLEPTSGKLYLGTDRIAVLDQRVALLDDAATLLENLQRTAPTRPEHDLRVLLGRFLFGGESVFKRAGVLSGGERLRAGLACVLAADQAPELLILDEPTNNLDLSSLEEVVSTLQHYGGTLIVISHDEVFLEEIGIQRRLELVR